VAASTRRAPGSAPVALLTGIPGVGKTSIGREAVRRLRGAGARAELLDGDDLRKGLPPALGFTPQDRRAQARRAGYVADLLSRNGVVTIIALVIPFRRDRRALAERFPGRFLQVWVRASLETCRTRDPQGVYTAAGRRGDTDYGDLVGCYEEPSQPDLVLDTDTDSLETAVARLERALRTRSSPRPQATS
jgi:adenylylsulfate kinase-like enzyme